MPLFPGWQKSSSAFAHSIYSLKNAPFISGEISSDILFTSFQCYSFLYFNKVQIVPQVILPLILRFDMRKSLLLFISVFVFFSCQSKMKMPLCMHDNSCSPEVYYSFLAQKCDGSSCCEASLKIMKKNNFKEVSKGISECSDGLSPDMLKCQGTLKWCAPKNQ